MRKRMSKKLKIYIDRKLKALRSYPTNDFKDREVVLIFYECDCNEPEIEVYDISGIEEKIRKKVCGEIARRAYKVYKAFGVLDETDLEYILYKVEKAENE